MILLMSSSTTTSWKTDRKWRTVDRQAEETGIVVEIRLANPRIRVLETKTMIWNSINPKKTLMVDLNFSLHLNQI